MNRLIIRHAKQIVQVCSNKEQMVCNAESMKSVSVMESSGDDVTKGLSIVVDANGVILERGGEGDDEEKDNPDSRTRTPYLSYWE